MSPMPRIASYGASLFSATLLFVTLSSMITRHTECWPLEKNLQDDTNAVDSQIVLLRELEQRQMALKEQQAYNEHLANVLYSMMLNNANNGETLPDSELVDHRLLYRASRSHGKPTFIRFGKRASPAFIRFGKRVDDGKNNANSNGKNNNDDAS